ncbi:hypothetical protein FKM82_001478 [Ascaphus truei]
MVKETAVVKDKDLYPTCIILCKIHELRRSCTNRDLNIAFTLQAPPGRNRLKGKSSQLQCTRLPNRQGCFNTFVGLRHFYF